MQYGENFSKRPLFGAFLACLVASSLAQPCMAACLTPPGDVTGNGTTNVADAQCNVVVNLWSLAGQTGTPPGCLQGAFSPSVLADHTCDTVINVADTLLAVHFALNVPLSATIDANANNCADACESDLDGDGAFDLQDCAPHDPLVHPGAAEVCDGFDDNCNGVRDDSTASALNASCMDLDLCNGAEQCGAIAPWPSGVYIAELHVFPQSAAGLAGRWVELHNTTGSLLNIRGWSLVDGAGAAFVIDPGGALFVPANGRVVIAASTDLALNGGVKSPVAWTGLALGANEGAIELRDLTGQLVERAVWSTGQVQAGASLSRVSYELAADSPAAFAVSSLVFGAGDRGTPGGPNRDVVPTPCVEGTPVECAASGPCVSSNCDPATGGCVGVPAPNGSSCDDENACTGGDFCLSGACSGLPLANCCGNGFCEPGEVCGCAQDCDGSACDDGNVCTGFDTCLGGACGGVPVAGCCGNGVCEPGEVCSCAADCVGVTCDAGACLQGATCLANGTCGGGFPVPNCCGNGFCEPGEVCGCAVDCAGVACDDGDPATSGESCQGDGTCGGGVGGCGNGVKDPGETDIDCGGGTCPACSGGEDCLQSSDCESLVCQSNLCATAAACTPLGFGSTGALGDLVITGSAAWNTTTGALVVNGQTVLTGSEAGIEIVAQPASGSPWPPPSLRVYHFREFGIAAGATVNVSGSRGLAILATGTVTIAGNLDASGSGGEAGGPNDPGVGGAAGPGGGVGGQFVFGPGCSSTNGLAAGPGAGQNGACGGQGSQGQGGSGGPGGGGGGGGCGGAGGAGSGHATAGGSAQSGGAGEDGDQGNPSGGTPGRSPGSGCGGSSGTPSGGPTYGSSALPQLYGGTGGSAGGYGGLAGRGGSISCSFGSSAGGLFGQSGGPGAGGGGGGAVLVCAGSTVVVPAGGKIDVSGGFGGFSGFSQLSNNGGSASNPSGPCGGGGGGGRSGRGGSGGGGAGGSMRLAAPTLQLFGQLDAGGGSAGSSTLTLIGSGAFGGVGKNGGGSGGRGGDGGGGGGGGSGGLGYIRLEADALQDAAVKQGVVTSGGFE